LRKTTQKPPYLSPERRQTIRHEIISLLKERKLSAKDISAYVGIPEKEVYGHLEHIRKTLGKNRVKLIIIPPECITCGFIYKKRERLTKPGRCPVCRNELIQEALFQSK